MPARKMAVVILCNRDWAELWRAAFYKAIDLWGYHDNSRDFMEAARHPYEDAIAEWEKYKSDSRNTDLHPTLSTQTLAGLYQHPMLGTAQVLVNGEELQVIFNNHMNFRLEHWRNDQYLARPQGRFYDLEDFFTFTDQTMQCFGADFQKQAK